MRRLALVALAMIVAGCQRPSAPMEDGSPWMEPARLSHAGFDAAVHRLRFVGVTEHGRRAAGRVIEPEATAHLFDPATAYRGDGRVLARITDPSGVMYWVAFPATGESVYYNAHGVEVGRGSFAYCQHAGTRSVPDASFDMIHDASWQCAGGGVTALAGLPFRSTWVSCVRGCCNGR